MDEKAMDKKFTRRYFTNVVLMIVFIIGLFFLMGYIHETAHSVIFGYYGLESEIHLFRDFPDMVTEAQEPCPVEACRQAQANVDAVGYHLMIMTLIFLTLWAIYQMNGMIKEEIEERRFLKYVELQEKIIKAASQ